jgi:hypothetical protein
VSSGISKYFELSDISGKYSSTNIFANDGILYREKTTPSFEFKFQSRNEIFAAVKNQLAPIVVSNTFKNFYRSEYPRPAFGFLNYTWTEVTKKSAQTTGYFQDINKTPVQLGYFSGNNATYITQGALVKFAPPAGEKFRGGLLVTEDSADVEQTDYIWAKVVQVVGDGTNQLKGVLKDGTGPVILSGKVPSRAIPVEVC